MSAVPLLTALEALKNIPRRGWIIRKIPEPESVADHMHRMAIICLAYPWVRWGCYLVSLSAYKSIGK